MSKIKNDGLDQYGAAPVEQQQFGTTGVEGVNVLLKITTISMHHPLHRIKALWRILLYVHLLTTLQRIYDLYNATATTRHMSTVAIKQNAYQNAIPD